MKLTYIKKLLVSSDLRFGSGAHGGRGTVWACGGRKRKWLTIQKEVGTIKLQGKYHIIEIMCEGKGIESYGEETG